MWTPALSLPSKLWDSSHIKWLQLRLLFSTQPPQVWGTTGKPAPLLHLNISPYKTPGRYCIVPAILSLQRKHLSHRFQRTCFLCWAWVSNKERTRREKRLTKSPISHHVFTSSPHLKHRLSQLWKKGSCCWQTKALRELGDVLPFPSTYLWHKKHSSPNKGSGESTQALPALGWTDRRGDKHFLHLLNPLLFTGSLQEKGSLAQLAHVRAQLDAIHWVMSGSDGPGGKHPVYGVKRGRRVTERSRLEAERQET